MLTRRTFLRGTGTALGVVGLSPGSLVEAAMKVAGPPLGQPSLIGPLVNGLRKDLTALALAQSRFAGLAAPLNGPLASVARNMMESALPPVIGEVLGAIGALGTRMAGIQADRHSSQGGFEPLVRRCGVIANEGALLQVEYILHTLHTERLRLPGSVVADARVALRRPGASMERHAEALRRAVSDGLSHRGWRDDILERCHHFGGYANDETAHMLQGHFIDAGDFEVLRHHSLTSFMPATPGGGMVAMDRTHADTRALLDFQDASSLEQHQGMQLFRSYTVPSRDATVRRSQEHIDREVKRARSRSYSPETTAARPELSWWESAHRPVDELALNPAVTDGRAQEYLDGQIRRALPLLPSESGHGNDIY